MDAAADTAFVVTQIRADEAALPASERLFDDPYARLFATPTAARENVERFVNLPFVREQVRLRTRFIDDFVRTGLAAGITQLVLVGAGFDCRALRLSELTSRSARVFELDFEAQHARKRSLLAAGGVALPTHVHAVPADLNDPGFERALEDALVGAGFRAGQGALCVMEGLIAYVREATMDRALALLARLGGPGTRVVIDYHAFGHSPEAIAERLHRAGFAHTEDHGLDALAREYLRIEPAAGMELFRIVVGTRPAP